MSPVSETTVVMARNCSSLLVMDEPPSATFLYPNAYPVPAIVAPWRVISKRQAGAPPEPNASEPVVCRSHSHREGAPMTNHKNLKDLFSETLKDIYFAEKQILRALP